MHADIQMNIEPGKNSGFCIYKNVWNETALKLKTDIKTIESHMQKIMKMRGVTYKYKEQKCDITENVITKNTNNTNAKNITDTTDNKSKSHQSQTDKLPKLDENIMEKIADEDKKMERIGFLAQEMEKIIPEVVRTSVNGTKAIAYTDLIAILVEGMKEQQSEIDSLKNEVANLSIKSSSSLSKIQSNSTNSSYDEISPAALYQNAPNPFSQSTQIKYYLPKSVTKALLCIYDLQGKQLKQITINERGNGAQIISASEFSAGIYLYGLIADGNEVDVKRMILTK